MNKKALIIGKGKIGNFLADTLRKLNWSLVEVVGRNDVDNYLDSLQKKPDVVFLAIATEDKDAACAYINLFNGAGIPVVTCEKIALSEHFGQMKRWIDKGMLHFNASVGGGIMIPQQLETLSALGFEEIRLVLNGTLSYIAHQVDGGMPIEMAVEQAQGLGLTESVGEKPDIVKIVQSEIHDIVRKSVILVNHLGLASNLTFGQVKLHGSSNLRSLMDILSRPGFRYVVTITRREHSGVSGNRPTIYQPLENGYSLRGDWEPINGTCSERIGSNCGFYFHSVHNTVQFFGRGAGAGPTVSAMIADANKALM